MKAMSILLCLWMLAGVSGHMYTLNTKKWWDRRGAYAMFPVAAMAGPTVWYFTIVED